jgi:hypothetical protein
MDKESVEAVDMRTVSVTDSLGSQEFARKAVPALSRETLLAILGHVLAIAILSWLGNGSELARKYLLNNTLFGTIISCLAILVSQRFVSRTQMKSYKKVCVIGSLMLLYCATVTICCTIGAGNKSSEQAVCELYRSAMPLFRNPSLAQADDFCLQSISTLGKLHGQLGYRYELYEHDGAGGLLRPVAKSGFKSDFLKRTFLVSSHSKPEDRGIAGFVFRNRASHMVDDVDNVSGHNSDHSGSSVTTDDQDRPVFKPFVDRSDNHIGRTRSILAVPIFAMDGEHKVIGVLAISSPLPNSFVDSDVQLIETVAQSLSGFLESRNSIVR